MLLAQCRIVALGSAGGFPFPEVLVRLWVLGPADL